MALWRLGNLSRPTALRQFVLAALHKVEYSDAIETFTSELINKSQLRNQMQKLKPGRVTAKGDFQLVKKTTQQLLKEINSIYDSVLCVDVRKLDEDQLSNLLTNSVLEENRQDINYLVNECMRWSMLPSTPTTLKVLEFFAQTKQFDNLEKLYGFAESLNERPFLLKLFKVKFLWREGNTDKALCLLDEIHEVARQARDQQDDFLASKELFLGLIDDAVGTKSEAVLLKLIHLIETLEDVSILEQVWNKLFTSEWFSDQKLALDLFRRHASLRLTLSTQTNYITFLLLKEHNVDAVYRLVELLLSHEMMQECQKVLGLLFDYQFWRKDLRTCSEIIQTCISLDIPLDPNYGRKLVMLLLAPKQPQIAHHQHPSVATKTRPAKKTQPPKVEFKF